MFSPYIIDTLQAEEVQIDLRSMAWSFYLRMISPFGPMMRVPGGTSFLTLFGGADSSHFSSSLPSGVRKRSTTTGLRRRMKTDWKPLPVGSTVNVYVLLWRWRFMTRWSSTHTSIQSDPFGPVLSGHLLNGSGATVQRLDTFINW